MQMLQQGDISQTQQYRALSILLVFLFFTCLLGLFALGPIQQLYKDGAATGLSCTVFGIVCFLAVFTAKRMGLPMKCYGFVKPSLTFIAESIVYSLLFCLIVFIIKVLIIQYVTKFQGTPYIAILAPSANVNTLLIYILLYTLFAPVQAMIFHSFIEGPLVDLLDIRFRAFICIGLATLFFASAHLAVGFYFTVMVFLPILFWCVLYYKHRCVWTIMISHILIGNILLLIIGMNVFLSIISSVV